MNKPLVKTTCSHCTLVWTVGDLGLSELSELSELSDTWKTVEDSRRTWNHCRTVGMPVGLAVGLSDSVGLSDCRTVGLSDSVGHCRTATVGLSDRGSATYI